MQTPAHRGGEELASLSALAPGCAGVDTFRDSDLGSSWHMIAQGCWCLVWEDAAERESLKAREG